MLGSLVEEMWNWGDVQQCSQGETCITLQSFSYFPINLQMLMDIYLWVFSS